MFICDRCDRQVAALAVGVYVQYGEEFAAAACPVCGRSISLRMVGRDWDCWPDGGLIWQIDGHEVRDGSGLGGASD